MGTVGGAAINIKPQCCGGGAIVKGTRSQASQDKPWPGLLSYIIKARALYGLSQKLQGDIFRYTPRGLYDRLQDTVIIAKVVDLPI